MSPDVENRLRSLAPMYFENLSYFECGDGWAGLIEEVISMLKKRQVKNLRFTQAKEKWGALRLYVGPIRSSYADWWFEYAEEILNRSMSICETCGEPGLPRGGIDGKYAWIQTLCEEHARGRPALRRSA